MNQRINQWRRTGDSYFILEDAKDHHQEDDDAEHQETDNILDYSIEYQTQKESTLQAWQKTVRDLLRREHKPFL